MLAEQLGLERGAARRIIPDGRPTLWKSYHFPITRAQKTAAITEG
jgi:hypothetical protein